MTQELPGRGVCQGMGVWHSRARQAARVCPLGRKRACTNPNMMPIGLNTPWARGIVRHRAASYVSLGLGGGWARVSFHLPPVHTCTDNPT